MSFSSTFKKGANLLSVKSFVWQWQWELEFDDLIQPNSIFLKLDLFNFSKSTFDRVILPRNVFEYLKMKSYCGNTIQSGCMCTIAHTPLYCIWILNIVDDCACRCRTNGDASQAWTFDKNYHRCCLGSRASQPKPKARAISGSKECECSTDASRCMKEGKH